MALRNLAPLLCVILASLAFVVQAVLAARGTNSPFPRFPIEYRHVFACLIRYLHCCR
uniref:Predicted protein n=1 Tax=Hordeum vulgare subsp. vulgare TaxID=112509 RepID=F2EE46_HORVV|nr:predicted protein [Hordeum vulgare subsp. vulgare]